MRLGHRAGGTSGTLDERSPVPHWPTPGPIYSNASPRSCSCRASRIRFNARKGCLKSRSSFTVDSCGDSVIPPLEDSVSKILCSSVTKPHLLDRLERARVCMRSHGPCQPPGPSYFHLHSRRLSAICWPRTRQTTTLLRNWRQSQNLH